MHSHTYKFGTESFKTLSIAYNKFPFSGCCEFCTIGLIYYKYSNQKKTYIKIVSGIGRNKKILITIALTDLLYDEPH